MQSQMRGSRRCLGLIPPEAHRKFPAAFYQQWFLGAPIQVSPCNLVTWLLSARLGEQSMGVEIQETPHSTHCAHLPETASHLFIKPFTMGMDGRCWVPSSSRAGAGPRVPGAFRSGPGAGVGAHLLRQSEALSDRKTSALHWKVARPSGSGSQLCRLGMISSTHTAWGRDGMEGLGGARTLQPSAPNSAHYSRDSAGWGASPGRCRPLPGIACPRGARSASDPLPGLEAACTKGHTP